MEHHAIEFTRGAVADLAHLSAFERKRVVAEVKRLLAEAPASETKNKKQLRENPLARWELRIGRCRAFYEVDSVRREVVVGAVGYKVHNVLYIRGREVKL